METNQPASPTVDATSFVKDSRAGDTKQTVGQGTATVKIPQKREPTPRQIKAAQLMAENGRKDKPASTGAILKEAGYSDAVVDVPSKVTSSPVFQELLEQFMPDNTLAETHKRLLSTRKIEHMVFPLGPEGEDDDNLSGSTPNAPNPMDDIGSPVERTTLSDKEIKDMLAEVNCTVKRIVHGQTARHVYFWAHDAKAQGSALELAYKMKGYLSKDGNGSSQFNFNFGTQNFVDAEKNNSQTVSN